MKKVVIAALFCFVVGLLSSSAMADKPKKDGAKKKPDRAAQFKKLDKDGDGKLTKEEFVGKREGDKAAAAEKVFGRLDKDGNGTVCATEFSARGKKAPKKKDGDKPKKDGDKPAKDAAK